MSTSSILQYIGIALVVALLGVFAGWYFFLHSREQTIGETNQARGLGAAAPTFPGTSGSTATEIQESAGGFVQSSSGGATHTQRLWEVDPSPVAGFGFAAASTTDASSSDLFYAERATGYIFEADANTDQTIRLTDTLMPKTYQAIFANTNVLLRGIDAGGNITTFAGSFESAAEATTTLPQALNGNALDSNIIEIAVNPSNDSLFYLSGNAGAGVVGLSDTWSDSKRSQIFSSPIADWNILWGKGAFVLLEKPADNMSGYAYLLSKTGTLSLIEGPLPGLTFLPDQSESAYLFGTSSGGGLSLYTQIGSQAPLALSIHTIADKCAWAPGQSLTAYCAVPATAPQGNFLDEWYQGAVHTSDSFWEIDGANGTAQLLYTPTQSLDIEDPVVDPSGNFIAFRNGTDQSLWILQINQ